MRILIVVHGYPPTFTGGAELRAERTARGMAGRQHDIAVLSIESLHAPETRLIRNEQLQGDVLTHQLYVQEMSALGDGYQTDKNQIVQKALQQLIIEWCPDVIHLFSGYLMGIGVIETAAAHQVPVIVSLTDYWWLCHRINLVKTNGSRCDGPVPVNCARCRSEVYRRFRLPSTIMRPLADQMWYVAEHVPAIGAHLGVPEQANRLETMLTTLDQANAMIAPSRFLADIYIRHGVRTDRMHVWRQGVNLSHCPPRKPSATLRFGYFGQVKHHKGIHTLIEAAGLLQGNRPYSLTLYGSDHGEQIYGSRLREAIQLMANVSWQPAIAHSEVWQALAEIDVLVIPSRWYENSPNVILEAQAMGVVVIGSNLGGVAELVQSGRNGLLFTPDDAADLATQMQRLLDEANLLSELRQNPIPFHSFNDELDQIEGLYQQLAPETTLVQPFADDQVQADTDHYRTPAERV